MSEFPTRRLDELIADGTVMLGRGDVISKDDIEAHPGPYPIYSSSAHNNGKFGEYGKFIFDEELITWSVDGGGSFFYRPKHKYSVTNVCGYMRLRGEKLHPKFAFYSLASQHRYLTFDYTSKAHPSVIKKQYWLPTLAIERQQKIAAILTSIDTAIEKTEALIEKYRQIKAGLMRDLFTRGVLPNGQLRPPREQAPELYQETAIGWIPRDWGLCRVEDCGEVKLGRQRSPDQHSGKWTMPYLRVANVFDGFIDFSDVLAMDFTPNERRMFALVDGDILLNEGQSLELVGRSAIYRGESEQFCFQNTLVRFRCKPDNYPTFFGHLFKLWLDGGQFQRIAKQTTSVAHLGADRFARMSCPVVDGEEQLRIAEKLDQAVEQIESTCAHRNKLQSQKLGLMQDLLTGKVPVKVGAGETAHG